MKVYNFTSKLSDYINGLVSEKLTCGYLYDTESYLLYRFDKFTANSCFNDGTISKDLTDQWSIQSPTESINYRNKRISIVRELSKYMITLGLPAYIPPQGKSVPAKDPYILSKDEINELFYIIDHNSLPTYRYIHQKATYSVMFRLYICCGLRLSECINIQVGDINFLENTIDIIKSKGDHDRKVYVSHDLINMCKRYNDLVKISFPVRKHFFVLINPNIAINKTSLDKVFKNFWKKTSYYNVSGKNPTIHSLRHTYVVNCLHNWMLKGFDIQKMMPYLSRQLGHSSVDGTQYYYHTTIASAYIIKQIDQSSKQIIPEINTPIDILSDQLSPKDVISTKRITGKRVRPANIIIPRVL